MTDRYKGLTIVFDEDIREDDAERYIELFYTIRHVIDVKPIVISSIEYEIAESRVRREMQTSIFELISKVKP